MADKYVSANCPVIKLFQKRALKYDSSVKNPSMLQSNTH